MWGGLSRAKGASRWQNVKRSDVPRAPVVASEGGRQEPSENGGGLHLPGENVQTGFRRLWGSKGVKQGQIRPDVTHFPADLSGDCVQAKLKRGWVRGDKGMERGAAGFRRVVAGPW